MACGGGREERNARDEDVLRGGCSRLLERSLKVFKRGKFCQIKLFIPSI
jgi:hypothetical protein